MHIVAAKQWHDEIGNALSRCDWFIVVLTPDSVRSQMGQAGAFVCAQSRSLQ